MPAKRKRSHEASTSKKRLKQDDRIELGEPDVWEVEEILQEDARRYKIAWASNKSTGQTYSSTWENKSNVNQEAIDDWEAKKRTKKPDSSIEKKGRARKLAVVSTRITTAGPRRRRTIPDSSPPTSIPKASRRVIESSPSLGTQNTDVLRVSSAASTSSQEDQPEIQPSQRLSLSQQHSAFEITIPQLRQSQQDQYSFHDSSPTFPSSQIVTGTAPPPLQAFSQARSSQALVDAAAAPDLTQKHSQYEHNDTSGSAIGTTNTTSVDISNSDQQVQPRSIDPESIEDSEEQAASQSYVPPTQTESKQSSGGTVYDNISVALDPIEDISDASASSPEQPYHQGRQEDRSSLSREPDTSSSSPSAEHGAATAPENRHTHISETVEERDFAGTILSASQLPIVVSPDSPGIQSFQGTQIPEQPLHRRLPGDRRRIPSSIDSAFFPTQRQNRSWRGRETESQPSLNRRTGTDSRSQQLTPQGSEQTRRLGSPFHARQSQTSGINDTSLAFKTQISPKISLLRDQAASPDVDSGKTPGEVSSRNSSSIHQPPSQWPETFHSAPPRPETISDLVATPTRIMSSRSPRSVPSNTSTKIQELKDAGGPITPAQRSIGMTTRSANRAGSPALARDARSPSAVPPAEIVPMPTEEENRTSERYLTLVPDKPQDAKRKKKTLPAGIVDEPHTEDQHQLAQTTSSADLVANDDSSEAVATHEFLVPIFFSGAQRDTYKNVMGWDRALIDQFLKQSWPEDSSILSNAQAFVARLHSVTNHPDLLNEESFTQAQIAPGEKAQWDKNTSVKFAFLYHLMSELATQNLHMVIDVEHGRLLDVLDNFLTGLHISHIVAGRQEQVSQEPGLRVTLLPKTLSSTGIPRADLVISFEGNPVLVEEERKALRVLSDDRVAPLIYLAVPKSVEHIQRHMASEPYTKMSLSRRLAILVENAALLRNEVGYRQFHDQDSANCASSIARWILDGQVPSEWPIDELPDLILRDPTSDSQATTASESTHQIPSSAASKRSLDDTTSPAAKKARIDTSPSSLLDMPSTINPSALSLSGITDTNHALATSEYVSDLANLRAEHEATESASRAEISSLAKRLAEHITSLEELQYRHEDLRTELVKTRVERDEAYTTAATAAAQLSSRDSIISKVKSERDAYKLQVEEAKAALHNHTVPEVAEVEKLKTRVEEAEKDKLRLEGRVESARKEAEYVRSLYQDASSKAATMAEEKAEMESRVEELEKKASKRIQQARLASKDGANQALRKEIRKLRLEVADRERVLKVKDEEMTRLKEKERGRMGTRGGSVPRSPGRLGSPMRLEPPRSSGVASRAGSPRRGSPAAGTLGTGKSKLGR
ncbi:Hypothetical protein D9617_3g022340 [Elsinoe fawcettii]|nr:Hypothetical protein D9617_3g022340 [Elsinoe fawcettii]